MGYFEYVMVLISIIVGLGLTHLLAALGAAVHRLRGHGPPIKLDATYLLWIGCVLAWLANGVFILGTRRSGFLVNQITGHVLKGVQVEHFTAALRSTQSECQAGRT